MYYYYAKTDKFLCRFEELPEIGVPGQAWHWTDEAWSKPSDTLSPDVLFSGDYRQITEERAQEICRAGR
ncbi:MAG: hypothetical protein K0U84_21850 [Actinomycetia bacterium]|nr:hypothetical protein [Actinomycetes bacterium]